MLVEDQILRLEIAVDDPALVQEGELGDDGGDVEARGGEGEGRVLTYGRGELAAERQPMNKPRCEQVEGGFRQGGVNKPRAGSVREV